MDELYVPKWMLILCYADQENSTRLARHLNITYSHVSKTMKLLETKKYIKRKKKTGREFRTEYTKKGEKLRSHCEAILAETKGLKHCRNWKE